jgi:hypothetical protein
MRRSDTWVAVTPWSFFLPTLLAAALGVFIANAASRLVFGGDAAPATASDAARAAGPASKTPAFAAAPAEAKAATQATATAAPATADTAPAPAAAAPLRLPGPSAARRDGEERACINGTVARRAENGWEQETIDDAPARCMATSP